MIKTKRVRGNPNPLIIEHHPSTYTGYPFITLVQYRDKQFLTIVDNVLDKKIKAYVLDYCGPEKVDEEYVIASAASWYENNREEYPLSVEFARLGVMSDFTKIFRSFNVEFVTRVIGPLPTFEMGVVHSVKRRRRKPIPTNVPVIIRDDQENVPIIIDPDLLV